MKKKISIACHNLRSAFNTGSIFRTADAAGLEKVYLCGYTPFPPHDKLSKTSRNTEQSVSWEHVDDIMDLIRSMKKKGVSIAALEKDARAVDYKKADYKTPLLLIVGNEALGLPEEILSEADSVISVPMEGTVKSLNVAVAAGIVIYEAVGSGT